MAFFRGPNIVKDNLVFGYDTGYPVVSGISDTYRFNSGEPTENLFPEPNYTITDGQVLNHIEFTRKPGQGYNGLDSRGSCFLFVYKWSDSEKVYFKSSTRISHS